MTKERKKKIIKYLLFSLIILFISFFAFRLITRDQNMNQILDKIADTDKLWLTSGAFLVMLFVVLESVQLKMLFDGMDCHTSFGKCVLLSNVGFFFSLLTPGASGGQPMQIVYMNLIGIDILVATLTCMIVTVIYKFVLVLLFAFFFLLRPELVSNAISDVWLLFIIGLIVQIGFMIFLMLCVFRPPLASSILDSLINAGTKLHLIKDPQKWKSRAKDSLTRYTRASDFLKDNKLVMLKMLLVTIIQRLAYFSVTFCVAKALFIHGCDWISITAIQVVLALAVDVIPIPGSAGLNEYVFMDLQDKLFGSEFVSAGVLLNRGLTFFFLIAITGILTIAATIYFNRLQRKGSSSDDYNQ